MKLKKLIKVKQTNRTVHLEDIKDIIEEKIKMKFRRQKGDIAHVEWDGKTIYIDPDYKNGKPFPLDAMVHEIGHCFYYQEGIDKKKLGSKDKAVTEYDDNERERFAENFKLLFVKPSKLPKDLKKELEKLVNNDWKSLIRRVKRASGKKDAYNNYAMNYGFSRF
jgi:hypothetical protein